MFPGWPAGAGFHRAAYSLVTPAWRRAELHTTAARADRQVDRQEDGVKKGSHGWTERKEEGGVGGRIKGEEKDDMNK